MWTTYNFKRHKDRKSVCLCVRDKRECVCEREIERVHVCVWEIRDKNMSKQHKSSLLVICELLISLRDIQIERVYVCVWEIRDNVCERERERQR